MSKNLALILGALVIVAVLAVLAVLAYTQLSKSSKSQQMAPAAVENTQNQQSTRGSIKSLLGLGKNVTCDITFPDGNGNGTIFVVDKKMHGDFTTTAGDKTIESHMISDGDYAYFWSGIQGTKMKIDQTAKATPIPAASAQQQGADLNKDVDYKCSSWSPDNSKFMPPADVKFIDLTQGMTQTTPQTGGTNPQSSYCNQITDPAAKAACMNAGSGY